MSDSIPVVQPRGNEWHDHYVITTDEFAYAARGVALALWFVRALMEDGVEAFEVSSVDCWRGVTVPTADDWGRIGEGAGCRLCCVARMDGFDAQGRAAFVRVGVYCEGCAA